MENVVKLKRRRKCPDRISSLPEHIISYILSFLPAKSAVATSFLSKSWKLRWTKISTVDFDDELWPRPESSLPMTFVEFVNMVLVNHSAEFIQKFRLLCKYRDIRSVNLNNWVSFAVARNVRILELANEHPSNEAVLPGAIYTSGTLEVLKLHGYMLVKLHRMACLPKLAVMDLNDVLYESDESLHNLVSGCPVLQSLTITRRGMINDNLVNCKVSSPALKHLSIDSGNQGSLLSLEIIALSVEFFALTGNDALTIILDVASVNEVELDIFYDSRGDKIAGVVGAFRHAKYLTLSDTTMRCLDRATKKLSTRFDKLTKLVLDIDFSPLISVLDLIDCCIKLEVLEIDGESAEYLGQPVFTPKCLLSSLRQVTFRRFQGLENELAMIKFILSHGLLMERVTLCSEKEDLNVDMLAKLCGFSRASPSCEISFSWEG